MKPARQQDHDAMAASEACPKCDGEGVTWEQGASYDEDGEKHYERTMEAEPCACQPERPTSVVEWRYCADELPGKEHEGKELWVANRYYGHELWVDLALYCGDGKWSSVGDVYAWAPLPTPPPKREG